MTDAVEARAQLVNQASPMYSGVQTKTDYRGFTPSFTGWLWWLGKGSLAVLDQALFAGANFIVNILLARWLVPADYGAFALAFSVVLLLGSFHTATLTEPMLVFGPGKYRNEFHAYLRLLLYGHFALMSASALLLGVAGELIAVFKSSAVGHTLIGAAIASPLLLLLWLVRRACYVKLHPGWSAMGGCLYLVILVPAMLRVHGKQFFTPAVPLVIMGVAALVVSGFLLVLLRPRWTSVPGGLGFAMVAAEHWHYSRWSLAAVVINCPTNIYFIILPAWLGLSGVGALRAILNVSAPASQTIAAFSLILLPALVVECQRAGVGGNEPDDEALRHTSLHRSARLSRSTVGRKVFGARFSLFWQVLRICFLSSANGVFASICKRGKHDDKQWIASA